VVDSELGPGEVVPPFTNLRPGGAGT
jgi:hypothetical protein